MNVCHTYYYVPWGKGNVGYNSWDGPNPPAPRPLFRRSRCHPPGKCGSMWIPGPCPGGSHAWKIAHMNSPSFFVTPGYGDHQRQKWHYSQAVRYGSRVEISGKAVGTTTGVFQTRSQTK